MPAQSPSGRSSDFDGSGLLTHLWGRCIFLIDAFFICSGKFDNFPLKIPGQNCPAAERNDILVKGGRTND